MNSNDVNSIINNLCDKLGTTVSKLIPEMAGYQIAKHSILLVISLIFIGVAIGFTIKLFRMRRNDVKTLALYPDKIRKLDEELRKAGIYPEQMSYWTIRDWDKLILEIPHVTGIQQWDDTTWIAMILTAVWSGLIGVVIFGIALYHIIGWSIAPNASAFMWIIGQLGGGQ